MAAVAADVTALYRQRLAAITAQAMLRNGTIWLQQFDLARPLITLRTVSTATGGWITAAQGDAAAEAAAYLTALTAVKSGLTPADVGAFTVPPGLAGSSAAGMSVVELAGLAPRVYWARISGGALAEDAARAASEWLNRIAASEPYRAANETATWNAVNDDRLTGRMQRITRPDACPFCTLIADRGYIPASAGFAAHAHCRCTPEPEISSRVLSRAGIRRARRALA